MRAPETVGMAPHRGFLGGDNGPDGGKLLELELFCFRDFELDLDGILGLFDGFDGFLG